MKLLFTHENKIMVESVKCHMESYGIDALLRNEFSAGGIGELAPVETWPELWVTESQFERAQSLLSGIGDKAEDEHWRCSACGEQNEASFEHCWQCQADQA